MARVLLLEHESSLRQRLVTALGTVGHRVLPAATPEEIRRELRNRSCDVLLIIDGEPGAADTALATDAEQRGVRTIIMAKTPQRLAALRTKGLICFQAPDEAADFPAAICARI